MKPFSIITNNLIVNTIGGLVSLLDKKEKTKFIICCVLIILNSITDIVGLSSVFPQMSIVINPSVIDNNKYLHAAYEAGNFSEPKYFVLTLIGIIFLIIVLRNLFGMFVVYYQSRFSADLATRISDKTFDYYYKKEYEFVNNTSSSLFVKDLINTPGYFSQSIILPLMQLMSEFFIIVIILVAIATYNVQVLIFLTTIIIPGFLLTYSISKRFTKNVGKEVNALHVEIQQQVYQIFHGFADVLLLNKQFFFKKRAHGLFRKRDRKIATLFTLYSFPGKLIEVTAFLGLLVIFIYSLFFADPKVLVPLLLIFGIATYRVMPSINRIISSMITLRTYQFLFGDIKKIYTEKAPVYQDIDVKPISFNHSIELKNIGYSYDKEQKTFSLENINLSIKKGSKIGIVGKTGSGKSTLIKILLGLLYPQQGELKVDDQVVSSSNINRWRATLAYVQQNIYILDSSIAENIAFGIPKEEIDQSKLELVIKNARLDEFVYSLPQGIDTNIGEMGNKLSGGQKQRIGIARALYKNAEIIVLDEATSALDMKTEKEVTDIISSLTEITLIVIAHRITTLKYCEKIYEMEKGKIINELTYDELIEKNK